MSLLVKKDDTIFSLAQHGVGIFPMFHCSLSSRTYQVSHSQHTAELVSHGIVLHGHKQGIQYNANCYGEINKWIHHN